MTTKEWLRRARALDKEINQLLIAKQEAYEKALGGAVDTSEERVQSSSGNGTENKLINLVEYDFLLNKRIDELVNCKAEILKAINCVDNTLYRTLLIAYYVNCKTWEEVAKELNYDLRWVYRLHGRALQAIESHYNHMLKYKLEK